MTWYLLDQVSTGQGGLVRYNKDRPTNRKAPTLWQWTTENLSIWMYI
jgi:hypothetical protein